MDEIASTYAQAMRTIKEDLGKGNPNDLLNDRLEKDLKVCRTSQELLTWIDRWYGLYIISTDYLVLNASLLDRIAGALEDERPLCVVVGDIHAIDLTGSPDP